MTTSDVQLLTAKELLPLLKVSQRWLYEQTRTNKIPCIRLPGGGIRFRPHEVAAYIETLARKPGKGER